MTKDKNIDATFSIENEDLGIGWFRLWKNLLKMMT